MDRFLAKSKEPEKRKASPRPSRAAKKKKAAVVDSEEDAARGAVVRADRLALEDALVALVADGTVSMARLGELGIAPVAERPKGPKVTQTSELTATGGMGLWERLDHETLINIITGAGEAERFTLSEVCKGLCALRREPRCWESLDISKLSKMTANGLRRLAKSIPTSRVARLRLQETSKNSFDSKSYVDFLKSLQCKDTLQELRLVDKKFGEGDKVLKALMPLITNVTSLSINNLKAKVMTTFIALLKAMPRLDDIEITANDLQWDALLSRLAQLAAIQRGPGAKSILKRIVQTGWSYGHPMPATDAFRHACQNYPELRELQLKELYVNQITRAPTPPPGSTLHRLRVLKLQKMQFKSGGAWGLNFMHRQQHDAPSSEALTGYIMDVEKTFPSLEVWETTRYVEYLSQKDRKEGMYYQPPPVLRGIQGARFPCLSSFMLEGIDLEASSFEDVEMPRLTDLVLNVDHQGGVSRFYANFPTDASRAPILAPLKEAAEGDFAVCWKRQPKRSWEA
mmetsp:Transcript_19515/g.58051  ORF Transcript_19515/g.58051 Transcript_19515/m.58051 type:complete len:513 (+) Transcript_19515:140-1678(+)